jgi:hypothetical protein
MIKSHVTTIYSWTKFIISWISIKIFLDLFLLLGSVLWSDLPIATSQGLTMGTDSTNGNTAKATIAYYRHHNRTNSISVVTIRTACNHPQQQECWRPPTGSGHHYTTATTPIPTATGLQSLMALAVNIRTATTTVD